MGCSFTHTPTHTTNDLNTTDPDGEQYERNERTKHALQLYAYAYFLTYPTKPIALMSVCSCA